MKFRPERYLILTHNGKLELDPSVRDPNTIAFGFGRRYGSSVHMEETLFMTDGLSRICPGRFLADQTLFATVVTILSTLSITPPLDKNGRLNYPKV